MKVLVVEKSAALTRALRGKTGSAAAPGLELSRERSIPAAVRRVVTFHPDVVLISTVESGGLDPLERFRNAVSDVPVVVVLDKTDEDEVDRALEAGAQEVVVKRSGLLRALRRAKYRGDVSHAQRRRAEQATVLVEQSTDVLSALTTEGTYLYVSPASRSMFGYAPRDLVGTSALDLVHPDDIAVLRDSHLKVREGDAPDTVLYRVKHNSGRIVWLETTSALVRQSTGEVQIVAASRDITERKATERRLHLSERLKAIGQLAGGIAHDFNNLLTVILGNAGLVLGELSPGDEWHPEFEQITRAARQASSLTRQLLAFSRRQVLEPKIIHLNRIVEDTVKMLTRLLGEDVDVGTSLASDLAHVHADPAQLEQVLVNLAVNARDAMPRGGKLTIETRNVRCDEAYSELHDPMPPGDFVLVAVSDTGTGMDAETRARVFEPFFTTKQQGRGTGLGLATVYGVVKQSGGFIWVYSEKGIGTTFKVYFPRVKDGVPSEARAATGAPRPGTETILLVEDEVAVRSLTGKALRKHGYRVLEAADGEEALAIIRDSGQTIHLVVSDIVMPVMGGAKLAERLETIAPGLPILFVSGYTDEAVARHGILEPGAHFVEKPYEPETLRRKVRELLDPSQF